MSTDVTGGVGTEHQVIFDTVPAMIWFKDTKNRILRLNRAAANAMGLPREKIEGRSLYELNPDEADDYYKDDLEVIDSGAPKLGVIESLVTASGETRWLQTDKIPYRDAEGRITGVIVFATDITERKQAEEMLEKQRAFLRQVIDIDPSFLFVKDRQGRFVLANKALADAYGTTVDGIVGKTDADFNPNPEEVEHFRRDDLEVINSLQEKLIPEEVITDAAGNVRWLQTSKRPVVDRDGVARQVLGVATDITARKQVEEALKRAQVGLERRVAERTAELVQRSNQLQTAAEVSRAATGILDSGELIQHVVDLVQARFGLYYVGLFLVDEAGEWTDESGKWAVLRAGSGEAGQQMLSAGHKLEIGGESMIGWCIANQQARIALDVGEEAVRFDNPYLPETRSEMALPLIARSQAIGAMTVQSEEQAAFSDEDIAVLQTMADQVANAIENARLLEETKRSADRERLVGEIAARMHETLDLETVLKTAVQEVRQAMGLREVVVRLVPEAEARARNGSEQDVAYKSDGSDCTA